MESSRRKVGHSQQLALVYIARFANLETPAVDLFCLVSSDRIRAL